MSIRLRLRGFDRIIHDLGEEPFCVNDYDGTDIVVKQHIDDMLLTNLANEDLSLVPSCQCGELKGSQYLGEVCSNSRCGSMVRSILDEEIDFRVWIRQPQGCEKWMTPWFFHILLNRYRLTKPSLSYVEYLTQTNFKVPTKKVRNIDQLKRLDYILEQKGIKRGYNSFIENFDEIIEILEMNYAKGKQADKYAFIEWAKRVKEKVIMSGYLPVLNRSLFVLDSTDGTKYMHRDMTVIVNAVRRMTGCDIRGLSSVNVQNRMARTLADFAGFYANYFSHKLFKKHCLIRQNITRTRSHFTIRAVVTSRTDRHKPNEILLPWSASTSAFGIHIVSALMEMGYTYRDAQDHLHEHVNKYSPIIADIFKRLFESTVFEKPVFSTKRVDGKIIRTLRSTEIECGFPIISNRNPSLGRGSYLPTFGVGVKEDPSDNTVSISYLNSPTTNMDYDGDMLQFTLVMSRRARLALAPFEYHNNVLGMKTPNGFTGALAYAKSNISTISSWVYTENLD